MADIEIRTVSTDDPHEFEVTVRDGGEHDHRVTLSASDHERLTGGAAAPEQCVEAAFEFLLEREPKEAILRRFDLPLIGRYFPEFDRDLPRRLGAGD